MDGSQLRTERVSLGRQLLALRLISIFQLPLLAPKIKVRSAIIHRGGSIASDLGCDLERAGSAEDSPTIVCVCVCVGGRASSPSPSSRRGAPRGVHTATVGTSAIPARCLGAHTPLQQGPAPRTKTPSMGTLRPLANPSPPRTRQEPASFPGEGGTLGACTC